jgi:arylformamidase
VFDPGFAALGLDAARRIAGAGTRLVGLDYLSVESPGGDGEVHRTLLGAGVVLLEGIDLSGVEPGDWNLSALPMKLVGGEASPVRAVLWR